MTAPPPLAWWERLGPWGMTGAGAGAGLLIALVILGATALTEPTLEPVVTSKPATSNARAVQHASVESAAPAPAAPPSDRQPSLATRRAVYRELHHVGMAASREAERHYPLNAIPEGEDDRVENYLLGHQAAYESNRRDGRLAVGRKYGLVADELDAIEREGDRERWPLGED